jgi:hypothetical protein
METINAETFKNKMEYTRLKANIIMLRRYHRKMAEDEDFAKKLSIQAKERYHKKKEAEKGLTKEERKELREKQIAERLQTIKDRQAFRESQALEIKVSKQELINERILMRAKALEEMQKNGGIPPEKRKAGRPRIYPQIPPEN